MGAKEAQLQSKRERTSGVDGVEPPKPGRSETHRPVRMNERRTSHEEVVLKITSGFSE